jgi:KDO2-lipid IV(A) lauroyltransferase
MLTLARWLARWPLWLLHMIGGWLGWAVYALAPAYRRRFRDHARAAGVPATAARRAVAEAGRLVAELPRLWLYDASDGPVPFATGETGGRPPEHRPLPASVEWHGRALVEAARGEGRGVLFLTPHLGCFEITAQAYAQAYGRDGPMTVMYRPARQHWLRAVQRRARERPGLNAVTASLAGVRQMVRALRRGEAVGLLPDQVPPQGLGEWVPFFGRPAYTMTLAARLVALTDAVPLLAWGERLPGGRGYRVHVRPFPDADVLKTGTTTAAAAAVNRAMETLILECPQQYLWGYHRYKQPRAADAETESSGPADAAGAVGGMR